MYPYPMPVPNGYYVPPSPYGMPIHTPLNQQVNYANGYPVPPNYNSPFNTVDPYNIGLISDTTSYIGNSSSHS
jgi:hypothetical protein